MLMTSLPLGREIYDGNKLVRFVADISMWSQFVTLARPFGLPRHKL